MRSAEHRLKEVDLFLSSLRDLVSPEEFRNLEDTDPDNTYSVEDLKLDYLHEIMTAQEAQAIATTALAQAVLELKDVLEAR